MNLVWLSLSVLLWGLAHSLLASLQAKAFAARLFGTSADRFYRLAYNIFSGLSLLPIAWLFLILPDRVLYAVPLPWKVVMVLGQILAGIFLLVGVLQTGAMSFVGVSQLLSPPGQPLKLVTNGLYHYIRHPLYAAGLVFIWLSPGMTVNQLVLCAAGTVYIIIGARFEERKLRREFGDSYVTYAKATPMLIPFLRRSKSRG